MGRFVKVILFSKNALVFGHATVADIGCLAEPMADLFRISLTKVVAQIA
jgi:hypothetical protein